MVVAPPLSTHWAHENAEIEFATTPTKTAREAPAPLTILKREGARSALGHERRRHIGRRAVEIPAHAELHVMRSDVLERHRVDDVVGAVERLQIAGDAVAHVDEAIRQLDREAG